MREKIEYLKNNIAKELRKLRAETGLSQTEIVLEINKKHKEKVLNVGTLVRYERGTVTQNLDKLVITNLTLKLSPAWYRNDLEN